MPEKEISEDDLKNMSNEEIAELQKQNCIFCKIANKDIPAKIIHEDSDAICILDINPASEGHILVYPKKHYMIMPHMPDETLAKVFSDVKLMSHTLLKSLQCKGITIFIANGVAAGQKAPHALVHVFPRRENDGLVPLPKYEMSDEQIEKLKRELKPYMNQMFGVRSSDVKAEKKIVKDAEFKDSEFVEEKRLEKDMEALKEKFEEGDAEKIKDEVKHPKHKEEKNVTKKPEKSPSSKVDLDDIAKLFGG